MEKIVSIEEANFKYNYAPNYSGFIIKTTEQEIKLGIDSGQSCCEDWGYFMTNDNIQEFIGATVLQIDIVDECLFKDKAPELYEGNVMFVNIETSKGTLQFTAYNEHNGYYGHEAVVVSKQLNNSVYV